MHELSIVYNILEIVKEHAKNNNLNHINKVVVNVGEFCSLEENSLTFAFEALSKGILCNGAALVIQKTEAKAYCTHCSTEFKVTFMSKLCPICKGYSHQITAGYEILVSSIEGE
ncbi:MAG: hypA [Clostridia bacterium]|jgi:hydrogenase nickel incorporation protein HypA/HybF|nr:hypA [Clostridia bacterium]